jgi:hypothetical protein
LGSDDNFDEKEYEIKPRIAMAGRSIAIGCPSGLVKMFNRKDREQV